jgi:hypothetical protein
MGLNAMHWNHWTGGIATLDTRMRCHRGITLQLNAGVAAMMSGTEPLEPNRREAYDSSAGEMLAHANHWAGRLGA